MNDFTLAADPNCMDDSDPSSLPIDLALKNILQEIQPITDVVQVPIIQALKRILAEDLIATIDVPPAANSAMDGYALNSIDIPKEGLRELVIIGTSWAGNPFEGDVTPGTSVRIMTGGLVPNGADTIVMQENTQVSGDKISIDTRTIKGEHVRSAGEDFSKGDCIILAGTLLTPAHLGLIASLGMGNVNVFRKIRAAFFLTGDELCSLGDPLENGKIYDSNRYTLSGMLTHPGVELIDLGIAKDTRSAIEEIMESAEKKSDILITTGGVSVGDADYIKEVLEKRGAISFWKVAMKPGRPLAFGKAGSTVFFGLPGNPVSAMVTFYQFVLPALKHLMGNKDLVLPSFKVVCRSNLKKNSGRVEFQRGILSRTLAGEMVVNKTGEQGSGILSSMAEANCFIILPFENDGITAGETVEVQPFFGLL
ncbi:MAG: molybdopterin molybdotransferase [Gammaproteobacteria bacterium]|jgi:molybdopterin molybdotransferase